MVSSLTCTDCPSFLSNRNHGYWLFQVISVTSRLMGGGWQVRESAIHDVRSCAASESCRVFEAGFSERHRHAACCARTEVNFATAGHSEQRAPRGTQISSPSRARSMMKRIKHNILGIITRPQRPSAIITLSSHTPAQGKGVKEGSTVAAGRGGKGRGGE